MDSQRVALYSIRNNWEMGIWSGRPANLDTRSR